MHWDPLVVKAFMIRHALIRFMPAVAWSAMAVACGTSPEKAPTPPREAAVPAVELPAPVPGPDPALVVYVSDETVGHVVGLDPDTGRIVARIPVGKRPRGIDVSPDGTQLFVALSGSPIAGPGVDESTLPRPDRSADGIGVIDLKTRTLVRTLPSGQDPESFDISPDGKTLYVSNEETAEMSVLDVESGSIRARVKVGEEPEGVTLRPDGRVVYVTCEADSEVVAIDTSTLEVMARIKTGSRPRMIAFTRDGASAFVTAENVGEVSAIDVGRHVPAGPIVVPPTEGTPTKPRPMGAVLSPDGRELYVSLGRARSVGVVDVMNRRFLRSIEDVGARVWGLAVSPDGRKLYTANGPSGDVSVVDLGSGTVDRRIKVGDSPWGVVVVAGSGR